MQILMLRFYGFDYRRQIKRNSKSLIRQVENITKTEPIYFLRDEFSTGLNPEFYAMFCFKTHLPKDTEKDLRLFLANNFNDDETTFASNVVSLKRKK